MPSILFVCTGNICRSPVAEVLFREWLAQHPRTGDWQVGSAGTWAQPGLGASQFSIDVARARGLDLSRHRSRPVALPILTQADLVLGMTKSHVEALRVEFPQFTSKIQLLSSLAGPAYDIPDPYGGPKAGYEEMFRELKDLLTRGGEKIAALAEQQAAK